MSFHAATAVSGGPGRWDAEIADGWGIFGMTNGGYVMAMVTRAMEEEAEGRTLIATTGTFLSPVAPGPAAVDVETLKRGRSLTTLRATVSSAGREAVHVTGTFAAADRPANPVAVRLGQPPDLPEPEQCARLMPAEDAPLPPPFVSKVDVRLHPHDAAAIVGSEKDKPTIRGWFRLLDDEPLEAHGVVQATDALPPAIFAGDIAVGWTPTVELSIQVREPAPQGWLACRFTTRFVNSGMLEEDGEIFDQEGNLVALSRQLALVPL